MAFRSDYCARNLVLLSFQKCNTPCLFIAVWNDVSFRIEYFFYYYCFFFNLHNAFVQCGRYYRRFSANDPKPLANFNAYSLIRYQKRTWINLYRIGRTVLNVHFANICFYRLYIIIIQGGAKQTVRFCQAIKKKKLRNLRK